jgi:hypothetical protein
VTLIYVLEADHGVKVGITIQTIEERVSDLQRATGLHVDVVRTWPVETRSLAYTIEQAAHWLLRDTRTHGEWFHCHPFHACDVVDRIVRRGIPLAYVRRDMVA